MKNILFISACARKNSRTLKLSEFVLKALSGDVERVDLFKEKLKPLDKERLEEREKTVLSGDFHDGGFIHAKTFAEAEEIVIGAPFWDFSFPSVLKIYFENISVPGITFYYKKGIPKGLCRAKRLIYVTTSGGLAEPDFGFSYIKTLCERLYGIENVILIKAENLDIGENNPEIILKDAENEALKLLKGLSETQ